MKRTLLAVLCVGLLAIAGFVFVSGSTEASPATVVQDTGCVVRDANGTQIWDPDCKVHLVYKYDAENDLQFIHYQDKGRLPDGAPRPRTAVRTQAFINCNGCLLQGTYEEVLTPSGNYTSSGPY